MTNERKPVLLTEAEWQRISAPLGLTSTIDQIANELRERGLIAPEPDERVSALVKYFAEIGILITERQAEIAVELVASRMELAKPELTREMVRDAWCTANSMHKSALVFEDLIDRLHAALTGEA